MKLPTITVSAILITTVSSLPANLNLKRDVPLDLIPPFGFTAGKNPTGTGDCDGAVNDADGKPIKIPCSCPPDRQVFIASLNKNVAAGKAVNNPSVKVTFPIDNSTGSQSARLTAAAITLQNLNGPGKGCPVVSTTFAAQQKAIDDEGANAASPAAMPSPAMSSSHSASSSSSSSCSAAPKHSAAASGQLSLAFLDKLTPQFGVAPNQNRPKTGDCVGIDGIKIPCDCPPDRRAFLKSLRRNIEAGKATHNPSIKISFPTDNDDASQRMRIEAAIVTMQNLDGAGKGCPIDSTTFLAQLAAVKE